MKMSGMDKVNEKMVKDSVTVLFVDDDQVLLDSMQHRFYDMGYRAVIASNGEEALEMVRRFPVDVAVLDVTMPGMDGFKLLKELRAIVPDLPSLFLTGRQDRETMLAALKLKSNCLVEKPCTPQELDSHIKRLLLSVGPKRTTTKQTD